MYAKKIDGNITELCKNKPLDINLKPLPDFEYISETDQEVVSYINSFNTEE